MILLTSLSVALLVVLSLGLPYSGAGSLGPWDPLTCTLPLLTWVDTFSGPHPCLECRTERQPVMSPPGSQILRSCSWKKCFRVCWRQGGRSRDNGMALRAGLGEHWDSEGAHFMPCWKTELRRVLQMMRSAHCTTTMLAKKAVWHVNSTTFRCS